MLVISSYSVFAHQKCTNVSVWHMDNDIKSYQLLYMTSLYNHTNIKQQCHESDWPMKIIRQHVSHIIQSFSPLLSKAPACNRIRADPMMGRDIWSRLAVHRSHWRSSSNALSKDKPQVWAAVGEWRFPFYFQPLVWCFELSWSQQSSRWVLQSQTLSSSCQTRCGSSAGPLSDIPLWTSWEDRCVGRARRPLRTRSVL